MKTIIYRRLVVAFLAVCLITSILAVGASAASVMRPNYSRSSELADDTADENGIVGDDNTSAPGTGEFGNDTSNTANDTSDKRTDTSKNDTSNTTNNTSDNVGNRVENAVGDVVDGAENAVDDMTGGMMSIWSILLVMVVIAAIVVLVLIFFTRRK